MKYFNLIFLILFLSCNPKQERVCENFKNGKYKSVITIDEIEYVSIFTRNNCEVVFNTINPINIQQKKPILVKILRTYEDSYDFEYSYVGETTKQQGKAVVLE